MQYIIDLNVHAQCEDKTNDAKDSFYEELGQVFENVGGIIMKVGREDIFKLKIGKDSSHEISNDNGVRVVKFATSKN
jgi:hypothetical protein